MDSALKQRLIGAAVLVALAMIFLPMLLKGPDPTEADAARVSIELPAAPDQEFETRELPLTLPTPSAPGDNGVLGMDRGGVDADDPNAITTVDQTGQPAPRTEYEPGPEAEAPAVAVDAATGLPEPAAPPTAPAPETAPATSPAPAPVATAPPTPAALPAAIAGGRYAVNVGSFSNLDNARALADRLRSSGLPLTSEPVDVAGKPAMRLRVGPYGDRAAAEAARLRVQTVTGGDAVVVTLDAAASDAVPARTPARASTAGTVGFAVQLGALSSEADASALRDRARAAGFVAFHQRVSTERGDVWRVRVGPEADRAAAQALRDSVAARLGLGDAIVVPHP
jgi:cell division septation protein DedD